VKDKVIVGMAGAEYGIRGFIEAYDVNTGKKAWRFYTVNPGPDYWSAVREGDNLYTASVVALDADTGRLRWHFHSPRTTCTTGIRPRCRCWPI
jgi:alcohol dehydrogenase (cytochrome c)